MSDDHNEIQHTGDHPGEHDIYFEETTVGIGFVYTVLALAVILGIFIFG